jgi:hypothetical protein
MHEHQQAGLVRRLGNADIRSPGLGHVGDASSPLNSRNRLVVSEIGFAAWTSAQSQSYALDMPYAIQRPKTV